MASIFGNLFGDAGTFTDAASTAARAAMQGYGVGADVEAQGRQQLTNLYGQGLKPLQDVSAQAMPALGMYGKALGLGGAPGSAEAMAAFQTTPGLSYAQRMMQQATDRSMGRGGFESSGNLLTALQQNALGLSSQQYQQWLNSLASLSGYALPSAQSQANLALGTGALNLGSFGRQAQEAQAAYTGAGQDIARGMGEAANTQMASSNAALNLGAKLAGSFFPGGLGIGGGTVAGLASQLLGYQPGAGGQTNLSFPVSPQLQAQYPR
jgi:hypothetical protein